MIASTKWLQVQSNFWFDQHKQRKYTRYQCTGFSPDWYVRQRDERRGRKEKWKRKKRKKEGKKMDFNFFVCVFIFVDQYNFMENYNFFVFFWWNWWKTNRPWFIFSIFWHQCITSFWVSLPTWFMKGFFKFVVWLFVNLHDWIWSLDFCWIFGWFDYFIWLKRLIFTFRTVFLHFGYCGIENVIQIPACSNLQCIHLCKCVESSNISQAWLVNVKSTSEDYLESVQINAE